MKATIVAVKEHLIIAPIPAVVAVSYLSDSKDQTSLNVVLRSKPIIAQVSHIPQYKCPPKTMV